MSTADLDQSASWFGPLRQHPALTRQMMARGLSVGAWQMLAVAVGWQIYAITGSALDLGLVGLAQFLPMLALVLVAGHIADRLDRRRIVAWCQRIECLVAAALAIGTLAHLLGRNEILALMVVFGAARSFETPTISALLPMTVPGPMLQRAIAYSATASQSATILGPALGGLLYALGAPVPYLLAMVMFAAASVLIGGLVPAREPPRREPPSLRSVFAGMTFIWRQKPILGAVSLDLVAVLLGGATALLPIYARDILHVGTWGMGLLRAAPAVGAVGMSAWLMRRPPHRQVGARMFITVIIYGVSMIAFGLSRWLPLSALALVVGGAADCVSVVIRVSLVQTRTPEQMLGRVSAVNSLFVGTSSQLGEFESGVTAALFGAIGSVLVGGIGVVAVAAAWMALFPGLRKADRVEG